MLCAVPSPPSPLASLLLSLLLLCRLLLWNKSPFVQGLSLMPFSSLLAVQLVEFPGISCWQMEVRQADTYSRGGSFHPIQMLMLPRTELSLGSRTAFLSLLVPRAFNAYSKLWFFSESLLSCVHPTMWYARVRVYLPHVPLCLQGL